MILSEKVISIGFNPRHEKYREEYRNQIHDIIRDSYKNIGGYVGLGHGTKKESDAIHNDISSHGMKVIRRNGNVSAVKIYKNLHGRKHIAGGQNGTLQGKKDYAKLLYDDHKQKRAWAELSGAPEQLANKIGVPTIPSDKASQLLGREVTPISPTHYERDIAGTKMKKTIRGYPKMTFKEFVDRD